MNGISLVLPRLESFSLRVWDGVGPIIKLGALSPEPLTSLKSLSFHGQHQQGCRYDLFAPNLTKLDISGSYEVNEELYCSSLPLHVFRLGALTNLRLLGYDFDKHTAAMFVCFPALTELDLINLSLDGATLTQLLTSVSPTLKVLSLPRCSVGDSESVLTILRDAFLQNLDLLPNLGMLDVSILRSDNAVVEFQERYIQAEVKTVAPSRDEITESPTIEGKTEDYFKRIEEAAVEEFMAKIATNRDDGMDKMFTHASLESKLLNSDCVCLAKIKHLYHVLSKRRSRITYCNLAVERFWCG